MPNEKLATINVSFAMREGLEALRRGMEIKGGFEWARGRGNRITLTKLADAAIEAMLDGQDDIVALGKRE